MLVLAGKPLGFEFCVLDRQEDAPAASLADRFVMGDLYDREALAQVTSWADVTTYEIEHTDTAALHALAEAGAVIRPHPSLLALINDKLEQKRALDRAGIPVPEFRVEPAGRFPCVQKLRHGGYDGRGVTVLRDPDDVPLEGASFYEELVDIRKELAVLVARRASGEAAAYPVTEMEFDARANICSRVSIPARLGERVAGRARDIAVAVVEELDAVGIVAVELFWTAADEILVNEIAPRPHNSGHVTIEACETSQFEQHLRAICDLPLGSTALREPAAMVNLLGGPGSSGAPDWAGAVSGLMLPGVHVHWYNKSEVRPFRKMGHVTITAGSVEEAWRQADAVEALTWVKGEQQ